MRANLLLSISFGIGIAGVLACSANVDQTFTGGSGGTGNGGGNGGAGNQGNGGGNGNTGNTGIGGLNFGGGFAGGGGSQQGCNSGPNDDADGDGYTPAQGDCNDCDPNSNPGAIDVIVTTPDMNGNIPEPADEDCDGVVDNPPSTCDDNLDIADFNPQSGAKAIDLCKFINPGDPGWGVLEAQYIRGGGAQAAQTPAVGIITQFGTSANNLPQLGARMLGLSSGNARDANDPGECAGISCSNYGAGTPPGAPFCDGAAPCYPQDAQCLGAANINDDIGLRLKIRAPTNANGFKYKFRFFSFEYPEWVCTSFNDQYVALVNPKPMGANDGNISFDSNNNPVSVNVAFFDVCDGCPQGPGDMAGTNFNDQQSYDDAGGTVWLQSTAPITGGEDFEIQFMIWDTGDSAWDSTVLVDSFEWIADGGQVTVITLPPPPPN